METDSDLEEFTPKRELREIPLRRALLSYVVPVFVAKYQAIAVRTLWKLENASDVMWGKRQQLEGDLRKIPNVVAFFSCATALEERKRNHEGRRTFLPGFAFWIVFDWPEYMVQAFENMVCQRLLDAGLEIDSCKSVKGRGK